MKKKKRRDKRKDACMRFRAIEYATTNPIRTTIALGTTGAVALGAATSLKEILHLRYISFLLPLKKKPDDSDLLTIQEATEKHSVGTM